ncbi:hypothetical protein D3C80_1953980 [compost metagenome]
MPGETVLDFAEDGGYVHWFLQAVADMPVAEAGADAYRYNAACNSMVEGDDFPLPFG